MIQTRENKNGPWMWRLTYAVRVHCLEIKSCNPSYFEFYKRQLPKFVEHKKICHADIQTGLTFNGTDLGCRGASQLEETLKVSV